MRLRSPDPTRLFLVAAEVLLALFLVTPCFSKSITYLRIETPVIQKYLQLPAGDQAQRLRTLRLLFKKANCRHNNQTITGEALPNVICVLPSTEEPGVEGRRTANTIVIGAVSDHDAKKSWRNTVMLPLLAESMNSVLHSSNLVFVAFAGSEGGQTGLSWYVEHLKPEERKHVTAVVVLKSTAGTTLTYTVGSYQSNRLEKNLALAAETLNVVQPGHVSTRDFVLLALDHRHLPAIIFDSLPDPPEPQFEELGEERLPTLDASLQLQRFDESYNFLCIYLLYLDESFRPRHHGRTPSTHGVTSSR